VWEVPELVRRTRHSLHNCFTSFSSLDLKVLVGIKAELSNPLKDAPDKGILNLSVECPAVASSKFIGRRGDDLANELTQSLQRAFGQGRLNQGCGIDLGALCIVKGKACWTIYADCVVLCDGGSLIDALSIGTLVALMTTHLPKVSVVGADEEEPEIEVDDDLSESTALDVSNGPVITSVSSIGSCYVVDCTTQEELCATASLEVAVNAQGAVNGVSQKHRGTGATASLSPGQIDEMIEFGRGIGMQVAQALSQFVVTRGQTVVIK